MASFRDVQNLILLSHGLNFIDDEEFVILYDLFEPRNPDFPYEAYPKFGLDEMAESECLAEFRLKKRDIYLFAEVLEISANHRMWSKIDLWWNRGLMHAVEAAIIPLQIRGHDSEIRSASFCDQHDYKYFDRLHIWNSWPTDNPLESCDLWCRLPLRCTQRPSQQEAYLYTTALASSMAP